MAINQDETPAEVARRLEEAKRIEAVSGMEAAKRMREVFPNPFEERNPNLKNVRSAFLEGTTTTTTSPTSTTTSIGTAVTISFGTVSGSTTTSSDMAGDPNQPSFFKTKIRAYFHEASMPEEHWTEEATSEPPSAAFLFRSFLTPEACDALLGDLEEHYGIICKNLGKRRALCWYWIQALASWFPIVWSSAMTRAKKIRKRG